MKTLKSLSQLIEESKELKATSYELTERTKQNIAASHKLLEQKRRALNRNEWAIGSKLNTPEQA